MKKFFAILMSAVLMLSLAVPAMAVTTSGTVKNDTDRTYDAYQIFSGTQANGSVVLGDIVWGTGIYSANFLTALKDLEVGGSKPFASCDTPADVAGVLKDKADRYDIANAFANLAAKHLGTVTATIPAKEEKTLASGYYLLVDTSTGNNAQNPALLQVTNDTDLNIIDKSGAPSVDKTIQGEADAAEGSIGDTFTFVLTATMPTTFEGYDSYKVVFHDTMSKGLTYVEGSITVPTGFTPNVVTNANGTTITVTNDNVLDDGVTKGATLTVTYKATLNSDAVIGSAGNPNTVKLEYSNDPNWTGTDGTQEPTKETPEDTVVVYSFELDVTKVDGADANKKLSGAEFKLRNAAGKWVTVDANSKVTGWADNEEGGSTLTSDANGLIKIIGLDQGTYYLKETKAPAGYNLLTSEIEIVIAAAVTDTEEKQELTGLTIKVGNTTTDGTLPTGIVGATVQNNAGATLPETGGMGTTIFYTVGGVMVAAAVVLLITKKRMSAEG